MFSASTPLQDVKKKIRGCGSTVKEEFFLMLKKIGSLLRETSQHILSQWGLGTGTEVWSRDTKRGKKIACPGLGISQAAWRQPWSSTPALVWSSESAPSWLVSVLSPRIPPLPAFSLFSLSEWAKELPRTNPNSVHVQETESRGPERYFNRKMCAVKMMLSSDTRGTQHAFSVFVVSACVHVRGHFYENDSPLPPLNGFQALRSPGLHNKYIYLLGHPAGQYTSGFKKRLRPVFYDSLTWGSAEEGWHCPGLANSCQPESSPLSQTLHLS